jgi:hypothetical protein
MGETASGVKEFDDLLKGDVLMLLGREGLGLDLFQQAADGG